MRRTIIFLISSLFLTVGYSQENQKFWKDGELTWNDFVENDSRIGDSEIKYYLGYLTDKYKFNDTIVHRINAYCYVDRQLSWVKPANKNSSHLRYNQIIFDIVELHRRKLQMRLDRLNSIYEAETVFRYVFDDCNKEVDKFQQESNYGNDIAVLADWSEKLNVELRKLPSDKLPDFTKRNFGYALYAGIGNSFFAGNFGNHFSPSKFNLMYGFDIAFKKSILYLNATLGGGVNVKKDFISETSLYKDQKLLLAIIDVSYGYAFIDNSKFKLAPFAGFCVTELSGENIDNVDSPIQLVDYNLSFGINIDYKFKTKLKLVPNGYNGIKENVETSIRTRLYATRVNYNNDLQGYTVSISVGLCGFGNFIKINNNWR